MFLFNINNLLAETLSLNRVAQTYRLKGPLSPIPQIFLENTAAQGEACQNHSTLDLVLRFREEAPAWFLNSEKLLSNADLKGDPCRIMAQPTANGGMELRLSYLKKSPQNVLKILVFKTSSNLVIDHWREHLAQKVNKKPSLKEKNSKKPIKGEEHPSVQLSSGDLPSEFEEDSSWESLLGMSARALDKNTPELDVFRSFSIERNRGVSKIPLERRALEVPPLDFASHDFSLEFDEKQMEWELFRDFPLNPDQTREDKRAIDAVLKGMNFVVLQAKNKSWAKAHQGLQILERSEFKEYIPLYDSRWWAIKGLVHIRLGEEANQKAFLQQGVQFWREGLQRCAGKSVASREYLNYMAMELLRNLMKTHNPYAALSVLSWAEKWNWSSEASERFQFLKGEAFYQLRFFDEAHDVFSNFSEKRIILPPTSLVDRRLLAASVFRLGDVRFKQGRFEESIQEYSKGISRLPALSRINFEGLLLPEVLKQFPYVMFNRAEAYFVRGQEKEALRDLRSVLFLTPSLPWLGLVYYRLGDLLQRLGADKEQVFGAWRECEYRMPRTIGGDLCRGRSVALKMPTEDIQLWPRSIHDVESPLLQSDEKITEAGLNRADLKAHINILLAQAFIDKGEPYQALVRLQPLLKEEQSLYIRAWLEEYVHTAFVGYLRRSFREGKYKKVIGDFESQKVALFSKMVPSEALWILSLSYEKLGLWDLALDTYNESVRVREIVGSKAERPFDPTRDEKEFLLAKILVGGTKKEQEKWPPVEAELKRLAPHSSETHRLWVRYFDAKEMTDPNLYLNHWREIYKNSDLTNEELKKFSKDLKSAKFKVERQALLEDKVGVAFAENKKQSSQGKQFDAELLFELFDARKENSKLNDALRVLEFLKVKTLKELGSSITLSQIFYERGKILTLLSQTTEARQSFEQSSALSADSIWGKLSASELRK